MNGGSKNVYLDTNNPIGKGKDVAFERTCENIKKLVEMKKIKKSSTQINASYVISTWNYFDIENAAKLCNELGVSNIFSDQT